MYKIGIISDTHGLLRPEVMAILKGCDEVLHGGDINKAEIIERLEEVAPLKVVRGNNDKGEWAEALPLSLAFTIQDKQFLMVHNKKDLPKDLSAYDIVIYGHSHKYYCETLEDILYLNPGSCGKRRFDLDITMAVITLEHGEVHIERIDLPH